MTRTLPKEARKDFYTEAEAGRALGIRIARLHQLLDEYIFNEGLHRPSNLEFSSSDLLLLAYWNKESPASDGLSRQKVVVITKRR